MYIYFFFDVFFFLFCVLFILLFFFFLCDQLFFSLFTIYFNSSFSVYCGQTTTSDFSAGILSLSISFFREEGESGLTVFLPCSMFCLLLLLLFFLYIFLCFQFFFFYCKCWREVKKEEEEEKKKEAISFFSRYICMSWLRRKSVMVVTGCTASQWLFMGSNANPLLLWTSEEDSSVSLIWL